MKEETSGKRKCKKGGGKLAKQFFKIGDFMLAGILIACSFLIFLIAPLRAEAAYILIRVDGEEYGKISVYEDEELTIKGPGGYENQILIRDGAVCFFHSDCPDRLCEKFGWLKDSGAFAACLPNRVTLEIRSNTGSKIDAMT